MDEIKQLNEIGQIITGNTPKTSDERNYNSNDICFVKPGDIEESKLVTLTDTEAHIAEYAKSKARILPKRSVLVTCIGIIGKVAVNEMECAFNQQINAIIPDEKICHYKFLGYALLAKRKMIQDMANAPVVPILNKSQFSNVKIKVPSIKEQLRMVSCLETVDKLIDKRKQEIEKLDELVKSRFIEMFGDLASPVCLWKKMTIVNICGNANDIKCGPFGTQLNKDEYQGSGIAVWEIPQINSSFITKPTHFVTSEKAKKLEDYSIRPGDIAMSRKGNVGRCAIFPDDIQPGIIHSDVLRIRVDKEKASSIFIMYQLHFSGFVKHQIEVVSSGAIMAGINVTKLKNILIHVPPLNLQNEFANFVKSTGKSKIAIQKSLDELETLKKSLMQQYFG